MKYIQTAKLESLPQRHDDTWYGGIVRVPFMLPAEGGAPCEPGEMMWFSTMSGSLGPDPETYDPADTLLENALNSMVFFATGPEVGGHRPGSVVVSDAELADALSDALEPAGIPVYFDAESNEVQLAMNRMVDEIVTEPPFPGPLEETGVTIERFRAFAEAAALFFEAQLWRCHSIDDVFEIETPNPVALMRCATILGNDGQTYGLGFLKSLDTYWKTDNQPDPDDWGQNETLWALIYENMENAPLIDADLWDQENLPFAGDSEIPVLGLTGRGQVTQRADSKTLTFVEGLMRALAAATDADFDSGRWTKRVDTFDGPAEYTLSLPFVLDPPSPEEIERQGIPLDRRALEAHMVQIGRFLENNEFDSIEEANKAIGLEFAGASPDSSTYLPSTPLERAQDICYEAFGAYGWRRQMLACQALGVCPDCADAYTILAEALSLDANDEALSLYEQAVEAGRRALGESFFEEEVGRFWGITKARPYMRALWGLAITQIEMEEHEKAATTFGEMLRLNPDDNQGVRYEQMPLLICLGRDDEASQLIDRYEDEDHPLWEYGRALLAFRREGNSKTSRTLLKRAIEYNARVAKYLTGAAESGASDSDSREMSEDALDAAELCEEAWAASPGAIEWLDAQVRKYRRAARVRKPKPWKKKKGKK